MPERYQTAVWEVSSTARVMPSYQATSALAQVFRLLKENFQRRPPRALQWRATILARLTGWRWRIQGEASRRSLAIRVTGSRRDWQQWSNSSTA